MALSEAELVRLANDTADDAIEMWRDGKRQEALDKLLELFESNSASGPDYSWLAATWQMLLGQSADQALANLWEFASYVPEWFFANALALYVQQGDNAVSRAALAVAIEQGEPIAAKLLGKTDESLGEGIELDGDHSYPDNAISLWQKSAGAMWWLQNHLDLLHSEEADAESMDSSKKMHYKLWRENFSIGLAFAKRHEDSKARRALLSALKEARRLGVLSQESHSTLDILKMMELGAESQVLSATREQVAAAAEITASEPLKAMRAYVRTGQRLFGFEQLNEAEHCFGQSRQILESLSEADAKWVYCDERAALLKAAAAFGSEPAQLRRAVAMLEEATQLMRSYLGPKHGMLVDTMQDMHTCLEELGEKERAAGLNAEILAIDPEADEEFDDDDDEHEEHVGHHWSSRN